MQYYYTYTASEVEIAIAAIGWHASPRRHINAADRSNFP